MGLVRLVGLRAGGEAQPDAGHAVHKVITDKPIIKVPGCPPIAEVMTGVVTYILTFDRLPDLDAQGRPKMFYGQRMHDKCYRRPHFDAGSSSRTSTTKARGRASASTRSAARGRSPTTRARRRAGTKACRSRSSPAMAASAARKTTFWDKGSFYDHLTTVAAGRPGIDGTADRIGLGGCRRRRRRRSPRMPRSARSSRRAARPATTRSEVEK